MKKRGKFKKTTTLPDPATNADFHRYLYNSAQFRNAMFEMAAFGTGVMRHVPLQKLYEADSGPETYIH